jgi:hypothetical protein
MDGFRKGNAIEWPINDYMERIWKETVMAYIH